MILYLLLSNQAHIVWKLLTKNLYPYTRCLSRFRIILAENNKQALLAQETHTESLEELNERGAITVFNMIVAEHARAHGIATYVKQGIADVSVVESAKAYLVYSSTIQAGPLTITNVYKSPQATWTDPVLKIQRHPAVYAGDFNSHHTVTLTRMANQ